MGNTIQITTKFLKILLIFMFSSLICWFANNRLIRSLMVSLDSSVIMYLAKENSHSLSSWTAAKVCWKTSYRGQAFCHTHMSSFWHCGPNLTLLAAVDGKHFHCWAAAFPSDMTAMHILTSLNIPCCPSILGCPIIYSIPFRKELDRVPLPVFPSLLYLAYFINFRYLCKKRLIHHFRRINVLIF